MDIYSVTERHFWKDNFFCKIDGFTLLFEAFVLVLAKVMTFSAVEERLNITIRRVQAICDKYVDEAVKQADCNFEQLYTIHSRCIDHRPWAAVPLFSKSHLPLSDWPSAAILPW